MRKSFPKIKHRQKRLEKVAEGVGFEPTVGLPLLLISSQVPLTTQPPFQPPEMFRTTACPGQADSRNLSTTSLAHAGGPVGETISDFDI